MWKLDGYIVWKGLCEDKLRILHLIYNFYYEIHAAIIHFIRLPFYKTIYRHKLCKKATCIRAIFVAYSLHLYTSCANNSRLGKSLSLILGGYW